MQQLYTSGTNTLWYNRYIMAQAKKQTAAKNKKQSATTQSISAKSTKTEVLAKTKQKQTRAEKAAARKATREQTKSQLPDRPRVPAAYKLFVGSLKILRDNVKLFSVILIIYLLLYTILVGGLSGDSTILATKQALHGTFNFASGATIISAIMSSSANSNSAGAGAYQTMLLIIMSVVLIWALRQVYAGHRIRARDAFYQGVYPLIPFVLVLFVIGLELLPLAAGVGLYGEMTSTGIAVGFAQHAVAVLILMALATVSVYMLCSSIFALYIVTLPDMTPLPALRSARELVRYRRWIVLRKLLFLPVAMVVIGVALLLPTALLLTPLAILLFLALGVLAVAVVHGYIYALYKALL